MRLRKKVFASLVSALAIATMICGTCFAGSSTAHLNGGTSAWSGTVGKSTSVEVWGRNGPGSYQEMYINTYYVTSAGANALFDFMMEEPNNNFDRTTYTRGTSSNWKIKSYSPDICYGTAYIQTK